MTFGMAGDVLVHVLRQDQRERRVDAAGGNADVKIDGLAFVEFGRRLGANRGRSHGECSRRYSSRNRRPHSDCALADHGTPPSIGCAVRPACSARRSGAQLSYLRGNFRRRCAGHQSLRDARISHHVTLGQFFEGRCLSLARPTPWGTGWLALRWNNRTGTVRGTSCCGCNHTASVSELVAPNLTFVVGRFPGVEIAVAWANL